MRTGSSVRLVTLCAPCGAGREAHGVARLQLLLELAVAVGVAQDRPALQHARSHSSVPNSKWYGQTLSPGGEVVDAAADLLGADHAARA